MYACSYLFSTKENMQDIGWFFFDVFWNTFIYHHTERLYTTVLYIFAYALIFGRKVPDGG